VFPDIFEAFFAELPSHFRASQQGPNRFRHGLSGVLIDEQAGLTADDDLGNPRGVQGHHRQTTGLSLQIDHPERFSDTGESEKICRRIVPDHILASYLPGEYGLAWQKLCSQRLEVFFHRTVSHYEKNHLGVIAP
jgi:hypothetical protein